MADRGTLYTHPTWVRLFQFGAISATLAATVALATKSRPLADDYSSASYVRGFYNGRITIAPTEGALGLIWNQVLSAIQLARDGQDSFLKALLETSTRGTLVGYDPLLGSFLCSMVIMLVAALALGSSFTKFLGILRTESLARHVSRESLVFYTCLSQLFLLLGCLFIYPNHHLDLIGIHLPVAGRYYTYVFDVILAFLLALKIFEKRNNAKLGAFRRADSGRGSREWKTRLWCIFLAGYIAVWAFPIVLMTICILLTLTGISRSFVKTLITRCFLAFCSSFAFNVGFTGQKDRSGGSFSIIERLRDLPDVMANERYFEFYFRGELAIFFGIGCLIGFFTRFRSGENYTYSPRRLLVILVVALSVMILTVPTYALFEMLTYFAWWHRISPMIFISFLITFVGLLLGFQIRHVLDGVTSARTILLVLCVYISGSEVTQKITEQTSYLKAFATSWDAGNTYAVGHPFQNSYPYNVEQQARLADVTSRRFVAPSFSLEDIILDDNSNLIITAKAEIPSVVGKLVPIRVVKSCEALDLRGENFVVYANIGPTASIALDKDPGCSYEFYAVDFWLLR